MTIPRPVRTFARRVVPGLMADRDRRYERGHRERTGATQIASAIAGERHVLRGPFSGMLLSNALANVDAAAAKLLGSYEEEIADVFVRAIEDGTSTFVDVGCADGYYAVGMACAAPALTTHAFDIAASARDLCRQTAALNGVADRVEVRGRCDADELRRLDLDGALVLIDIEGAESAFLDGEVARLLARSRMVIEVHEDQAPGTGDELIARFARTHTARRVDQAPRTPSDHPALAGLSHADALLALSEHRGPRLYWLVLMPRSSGAAPL